MSVDQLPPKRPVRDPRHAKLVRYEEYIDTQIQSTRRMVRVVDIATVLLVLTVGVLGYLLSAAVVEHWLVTGGFSSFTRILLFAALATGAGYYAIHRLWPLCVRSINPVYAAQTIEQGSPSLKNSLLNLLLFRQKRAEISDAVYETLEEQAAQRLVRVPVDAAVDRTNLVRLGYVMIAIVTACALYKMFSPKDPLITAERVLMPWADIAPASRVSITKVEPGTVTIARGDVLHVSAYVQGISEDDPVIVRYTTADNQVVDRAVQIKPAAGGLQFVGQVPAATAGEPAGVAQDLRYRIEAGDARTRTFKVTVIAAPTITVERVDYDYPDYTGFADRSVDGLGDIRAIEGTRVMIHARANEPIEEASVDFEADGRLDQRMKCDGTNAASTFILSLRSDRQTPKFTSYVLRFTAAGGRKNRDPVKFPIDVLPDYGPEVSIRAPQERARDLWLDETLPVEIEARDPDFALKDVRIRGEVSGRVAFDEALLEKSHTGKFTGRLVLAPSRYHLQPGDIVRYWAVAHDNRAPEPNEAASEPQTFRIVSPEPNGRPQQPPDRVAQRDRQPTPSKDQQQDRGQDQQQPQDSGNQTGDNRAGGNQSGKSNNSQQPVANQQPGVGGQSQDKSDGQNGKGKSGRDQNGQGQSGQSSAGDQSGESQEKQSQSGGKQGSGKDSKPTKPDSSQQPGEGGQAGGEKTDAGQSSGNRNNSGQQNQGAGKAEQPSANGDPISNSKPDTGQNSPAKGNRGQAKPDGSSSPVSSEGDNDGEAFDRIQKFLERQGQLPKQGGSQSGKQPQSSPNDQNQQSDNQQQSGKAQQTGDGHEQGKSSDKSQDGQQAARDQGQDTKSAKQPNSRDSQQNQGSNANQSGQQNEAGESNQGDTSGASKDSRGENAGAKNNSQDGQPKPNDSANQQGQPQSPNGQQTSSKGPAGAGEQSKQEQGSPESQPNMKPTDKWQQSPSDKNSSDKQEPPSGARGKRESDSQGEQGGDKAGGGAEGGGQKSKHDGTGSSGQNQAADHGDGESSEQGKGSNSPAAGHDATSKDRTGQSGSDQRGAGSQQRDGQGNQSGGQNGKPSQPDRGAGDKPVRNNDQAHAGDTNQAAGRDAQRSAGTTSDSANKTKPDNTSPQGQSQPNNNAPSQLGGPAGSTPNGAIGPPPNGAGGPNPTDATAPEADAANLEYARKQTDMVLESLAEQMRRKQVDRGLLNELGWNEQDLKRFLDRWQQLKTAANGKGPDADAARGELDAALRSLGLHHGALQQSKAAKDNVRDLREGYRGAVPLEYQERLRAYNQGVSRAHSADE